MNDEGGMEKLRALGARSVPVVARSGKYVFAQVIKDVIDFLQLDDNPAPELTPSELYARHEYALSTAIRLVTQMPNEHLVKELPNRPRSWRVLMHHIFQIPTAFLDMEEKGERLEYEGLTAPPPDEMQSSADIAAFGRSVQARVEAWWKRVQNERFDGPVTTYFGETTRHEMFERTVWHSAQHTRQIASLLEQVGVQPDRPLTSDDIKGLPLTDNVWD